MLGKFKQAYQAATKVLREDSKIIKGSDLVSLIHENHKLRDVKNVREFRTLPDELLTPELVAIREEIKPRLIDILTTSSLRDEDYRVIGMIVQISASIENNIQRIIRCLIEQKYCSPLTGISNEIIRDKIISGVKKAPVSDDLTKKITEAIKAHHIFIGFRDMFAHFIMKYDGEKNVLVFYSLRARDSREISGDDNDVLRSQFAVAREADISRLLREYNEIEGALAQASSQLLIELEHDTGLEANA